MRNYEVMFVVRPTLEEEATLQVLANMKKVLEDKKAVIKSNSDIENSKIEDVIKEAGFEVKEIK